MSAETEQRSVCARFKARFLCHSLSRNCFSDTNRKERNRPRQGATVAKARLARM